MKKCIALSVLLASGAFAGSFTVIDPFGLPKCPTGQTVGCDVVGPTTEFDFYRADFNFGPTSGTINLYFNYGLPGQTNLAPFNVTPSTVISVADLFLYSGGQIYAIPLNNRTTASWGSATAGTVYQANSPSALLNSDVVLNNPSDIAYRPGFPVWINTLQASVVNVGSISILTNQVIDGQAVRFAVTINLAYTAGSDFANAVNAANVGVFTGTATCANDLVENPEPSTWVMLSSGAGLAMLAMRRRKRS